ncbi:MAG: transglutaminase-like domain-containing protein [Prevotellaceae bacterium]|jgi:transglutaminase-like putative cysteine protease|nr:transglutaminase-like domain-containing protein [Prevotellaceae bacterium]
MRFIIFIICLLHVFSVFSKPIDENKHNIIINGCTQTFTYKIKNKKLIVEEIKEINYLCTQFKTSITVFDAYSANHTQIDYVNVKSKGKYTKPEHRLYFGEEIMNTDEKICYFELSFYKQGETANVAIKKTYTDLHYFNKIPFNENVYVAEKTIRIIVPRWMNTEFVSFNFGKNIIQSIEYDASADSDIYTYIIRDLDTWSDEKNTPPASYIYPHLLILNHHAKNKVIDEKFFSTLQDLYEWNTQFTSSVINDDILISKLAMEITSNCHSDGEKIKAVYEWVQDNIRYLADVKGIAGYKPDAPQEVINKKYGDCKGMANLIKCLLRALNFDARLAWIGTNDIAYDFSFPTIAAINHVVCVLFLHDNIYYLDATVKYMSFDHYSESIQGRKIMIENGDDFIMQTIPETNAEQNIISIKSNFNIINQALTGHVNVLFDGECKHIFFDFVNSTKKDKLTDALTEYFIFNDNKYTLSNLQFNDLQRKDEPVVINYKITDNKNAIYAVNNKYYLNPDFRKELINSSIDTATRKHDYWMPYKFKIIYQIQIEIPDTMQIEYIPDTFSIERGYYSFKIQYHISDNKIFYNKELTINNPKISGNMFKQWNNDIEQLKKIYNEHIILRREIK